MRFTNLSVFALGLLSTVNAAAIPEDSALSIRANTDVVSTPESNTLEKRKGGGGGGRSGGSSSGSSSSGSSSSGGSSSGSSSSGSRGSSGSSSSSSNTGGRTSAGSGVSPSYGGGKYYSGGASTPYRAGSASPLGVTPYLVAGGALGAGAFYAHSLYIYPYAHPYIFHNQSAHNSTTNTTIPVKCVCEEYQECGCEDQTDTAYLTSVVGNGSASDMNATVARVTNINGTDTLVVNGTLANGTTASGGTDSAASSLRQGLFESAGWWVIVAGVVFNVYF